MNTQLSVNANVSDLERAMQTAMFVAEERGLTPYNAPSGESLEKHIQSVVDEVMRRSPREAVLVVGHGNTVPLIIKALGGPEIEEIEDSNYSALFILVIPPEGTPRLVRGEYGAR